MAENGKPNGLATVADFRAMRTFEPAERVRLPHIGKEVMLRRPTMLWFIARARLPLSLLAKIKDKEKLVTSDTMEALQWITDLLVEIMVEPRCSMKPQDGEISPEMIDIEDALFMAAWASGEMLSETNSLSGFRSERQPDAARTDG